MKNLFLFISLFSCITLMTVSCSKHNAGPRIENEGINVKLKSGDLYQLDLSRYGGNGSAEASILNQATGYAISEISRNGAGQYIYSYKNANDPKFSAGGTDKVVLKIAGPERGGQCNGSGKQTVLSINFTIEP